MRKIIMIVLAAAMFVPTISAITPIKAQAEYGQELGWTPDEKWVATFTNLLAGFSPLKLGQWLSYALNRYEGKEYAVIWGVDKAIVTEPNELAERTVGTFKNFFTLNSKMNYQPFLGEYGPKSKAAIEDDLGCAIKTALAALGGALGAAGVVDFGPFASGVWEQQAIGGATGWTLGEIMRSGINRRIDF